MIEAAFTSNQAVEILALDGIKACRERVTQLADDLFGRDPATRGTTRRITVEQMGVLSEAFALIDGGLPRQTVVSLFQDPGRVVTELSAALAEARDTVTQVQEAVGQFQAASSLEERGAAVRRVRRLRQRRLVAA